MVVVVVVVVAVAVEVGVAVAVVVRGGVVLLLLLPFLSKKIDLKCNDRCGNRKMS